MKSKNILNITLKTSLKAVVLAFSLTSVIAHGNAINAEPITEQRKNQLIHLVKQDCGSCHGMTLKGGLGPALTIDAIKNKPILLLQNTILYGRPGTAMPPWQTILNEQEALWISQQLLKGSFHEKK